MKAKNPFITVSTLFAVIGIITGLSLFTSQNYFDADTMLLTDENILPIFSGDYFQLYGIGSAKLTLDSDLTFIYLIHTDVGDMVFNGTVIIMNRQVQLIASDQDGEIFVPKYLIPIRWGKYQYLVEPEHISYFCEEVKTGKEPWSTGLIKNLVRGIRNSSLPLKPILPNRKLACP